MRTDSATAREAKSLAQGPRRGFGLALKIAISLLFGAGFAWLVVAGGVPLFPSEEALSQVQLGSVVVYVFAVILFHTLRALRWRYLIRPVARLNLEQVLIINWIGFAAIFLFPFRLGEFVRPAVARIRHGISASAALGTVLVERVMDGLVTSILVCATLAWLPRVPSDDLLVRHLPKYAYSATGVFAAGFIFITVYYFKRDFVISLLMSTVGRFFPKAATKLSEVAHQAADGLRVLTQPRLAIGFVGETLAYWGLNILSAWVLARGCGLDLGVEHMVAVVTVVALGILLPTAPGLFGSFQLAVSIGLKLYLPAEVVAEEGASFIFILYSVQALVMLFAGALALLRARGRR